MYNGICNNILISHDKNIHMYYIIGIESLYVIFSVLAADALLNYTRDIESAFWRIILTEIISF